MVENPRRIFRPARRSPASRRIGVLVAAALAVALPGCSETTHWTPAESPPKQPQVDWVRFDHRVMFDPRGRNISISERARLEEFLSRIEPRYGDQILIGTGTGGPEGEIGLQRVATVAEYLRGLGLKVGPLTETSAVRWDGAVRISVGRYVVTPPNCPDWTKSPSYDPFNHVSSNFGCATATNLGLMVADPGDLIRGRQVSPGDGVVEWNRINLYRTGNVYASPLMSPNGLPSPPPALMMTPEKTGGK